MPRCEIDNHSHSWQTAVVGSKKKNWLSLMLSWSCCVSYVFLFLTPFWNTHRSPSTCFVSWPHFWRPFPIARRGDRKEKPLASHPHQHQRLRRQVRVKIVADILTVKWGESHLSQRRERGMLSSFVGFGDQFTMREKNRVYFFTCSPFSFLPLITLNFLPLSQSPSVINHRQVRSIMMYSWVEDRRLPLPFEGSSLQSFSVSLLVALVSFFLFFQINDKRWYGWFVLSQMSVCDSFLSSKRISSQTVWNVVSCPRALKFILFLYPVQYGYVNHTAGVIYQCVMSMVLSWEKESSLYHVWMSNHKRNTERTRIKWQIMSLGRNLVSVGASNIFSSCLVQKDMSQLFW